MSLIVRGSFEWDSEKEERNIQKHGVSFAEAVTVFLDPGVLFVNIGVNDGEQQYAAVGMSARPRMVYVVHVERGPRDRIVSAWRATRQEERIYNGEDE